MKTFRNPYLATIMALLMLITSCNQHDMPIKKTINAEVLRITHAEIVDELANLEITNSDLLIIKSNYPSIEEEFLANVKYIEEFGVENLFIKHGMDLDILAEFDFYIENENNSNVYQLLIEKFNFESIKEAKLLFNLIEVYKIFENNLPISDTDTLKKADGLTWGCALALAGTIAVTAGAAFVTGGASLIVFLVSKGLATASIINACT